VKLGLDGDNESGSLLELHGGRPVFDVEFQGVKGRSVFLCPSEAFCQYDLATFVTVLRILESEFCKEQPQVLPLRESGNVQRVVSVVLGVLQYGLEKELAKSQAIEPFRDLERTYLQYLACEPVPRLLLGIHYTDAGVRRRSDLGDPSLTVLAFALREPLVERFIVLFKTSEDRVGPVKGMRLDILNCGRRKRSCLKKVTDD